MDFSRGQLPRATTATEKTPVIAAEIRPVVAWRWSPAAWLQAQGRWVLLVLLAPLVAGGGGAGGGSWGGLYEAVRSGRGRPWVVHWFLTALMWYSPFFGFLIWIAQGIYVGWTCR